MSKPNDSNPEVDIPSELLITNSGDPIAAIVQSTYPNLVSQYQNGQSVQSRAILASTIEDVDQINDYVMKLVPGEERMYYSADKIDTSELNDAQAFDMIPPEFLNSLRASDIPDHKFKLKIGTAVTLLIDLLPSEGLLAGTRLIVTRLGQFVLEAKSISGRNIGNLILLPRISMSPSRSLWPFKLVRRQFPISVSYATTIDKSQVHSLDAMGLYIPKSGLSRDQLRAAFSSVKSKEGLKILIHEKEKKAMASTINAVLKDVFKNL